MRTFLTEKTVDIYRQTYTGNKSAYVVSASAVPCYARPLDEKESSANGMQYGQGHFFMFDDSVDIKQGDRIVYDSETHGVEGVARHNRGITLPWFKQAMTSRQRNT
jgi:hypothetical protein